MKIVRLPVLPPGVVRLAAPPGVVVEGPHHPRAGADQQPVARFGGWLRNWRDGVEILAGRAELLVTGSGLAAVVWEGHSDGGTLEQGSAMAVVSLAFDEVVSAQSGPEGLELRLSADDSVTVVDVHDRLGEDLAVLGAADTPMLLKAIRHARSSGGAQPSARQPQQQQPPQPQPLRPVRPPPNPVSGAVGGLRQERTASMIPPPVWAVIGLLCLAGGLILIPVLTAVPDVLRLDGGDLLNGFRLLLLVILLLAGAVGAACLGLAFLLWRGDRVGRVLTVVLCGAIVVGFILGDDRTGTDVLAILAALGAIAALVASVSARAYFTGPLAFERDQPSSVVAARTILVADAALLSVAGALLLLAGDLDGKFVLIGLGLVGVSAGGFWANGQLRARDPRARLIASVLMGGYAVLLLMVGESDAGILVPVGLATAVPILLWLGPDAREYFGDKPIDYGPAVGMFQQPGRSGPDQAR